MPRPSGANDFDFLSDDLLRFSQCKHKVDAGAAVIGEKRGSLLLICFVILLCLIR